MSRQLLLLLLLLASLSIAWSVPSKTEGEGKSEGVVHELTIDSFDTLLRESERESETNWLISFYSPWCHHCKALEPVLEKLALQVSLSPSDSLSDSLSLSHSRIGKVDATKQKELAARLQVERFPTIVFKSRRGVLGKYQGPRDFDALLSFLHRMSRDRAYEVIDAPAQLRHSGEGERGRGRETSGSPSYSSTLDSITFVLSVPRDCRSVDERGGSKKETRDVNNCEEDLKLIQQQFVALSEKHQFHASFALLVDPHRDVSFCKYESNEHQQELLYCLSDFSLAITNLKEFVNIYSSNQEKMELFVEKNNFPLMSELENHNFKMFSHMNKTMVIAVVDKTNSHIANSLVPLLEDTARKLPESQKEQFIFGHLDGGRWQTFIRHHDAQAPSILVVDHDDGRHANFKLARDVTTYPKMVQEFSNLLTADRLEFRETVAPGLLQKISHRFETYYPWSWIFIILPVVLIGVTFCFPHPNAKEKKH